MNPAVCPVCRVVKAKIEFCVSFSSSPEPWAASRPALHNRNSNVSTSADKQYFLNVVPKTLHGKAKEKFVEHYSRPNIAKMPKLLWHWPLKFSQCGRYSLTLLDFHSALLSLVLGGQMAFDEQDLSPENVDQPRMLAPSFEPKLCFFLEIISSIRFRQTLFQFYLFSCSSPNPPWKSYLFSFF